MEYRLLEESDGILLEQIDYTVREFYNVTTPLPIVGFAGGMFHASRPLKDKDIIICVPDMVHVTMLAKAIYDLGFDSVTIDQNPYVGTHGMIRLFRNSVEYQIQVRVLGDMYTAIGLFPLSVQKCAVVVIDGECTSYIDEEADKLTSIGVCLVDKSNKQNWRRSITKYKKYFPEMKFYYTK